jgi:peptidoglycan/LPS O-acetylase OafA/YrhL
MTFNNRNLNMDKKLDYIDALRGYAILLVILAHTGQMFPLDYPSILKSIYNFGPRGVQLFFIVSAFTLFLSGEKKFNTDSKPVLHFLLRRFFRIAPLYYIGILFYSIINFNTPIVTIGNVLRNIFFINDIYPYHPLIPGGWSISSEMLFYLIVPFLFIKIKNLNTAIKFTFITLLFAFLWKVVVDKFSFGFSSEFIKEVNFPYFILFSLPVFGIGISFYFIIFKNDFNIQPKFAILFSILILIGTIFNNGVLNMYFQTFAFGIFALAISKKAFPIFVNRFIIHIGKISYSMYMVHFLVIIFLERSAILRNMPLNNVKWMFLYFILKFIITVAITSIISRFTHWLIEIPGQNIGRSVIKLTNRKKEEIILS